jgi:transcriptional regulator with XRE-family HTH domain
MTRAAFAEKIGWSVDGWAKIELGSRSLTAKILQKANEYLKLDYGFYFGTMSYEKAKQSTASIESIADDMRILKDRLEGTPGDDAIRIAEKMRGNAQLLELFEMVRFWDGAMIRRVKDIAYGYLAGSQQDMDKKEKEASGE